MKKIDIYNHIWPEAFHARLEKVARNFEGMNRRVRSIPMITDLETRFRVMDLYEDYCQVLSLASPPLEVLAGPGHAAELAAIANDAMAELVQRHPGRFPAFVAALPLHDGEAMNREAVRAIEQLGAAGVQIFTNAGGRPVDGPEFLALYRYLCAEKRPVWVHPARGPEFPDYLSEDRSKYEIWWAFGWPYETSAMMARLVFAGIFDELPDLRVITHHGGGMVPFFEGRVGPGWDQIGVRTPGGEYRDLLGRLERRPLDYFRLFYADTAVFGSRAATICALDFFGPEHLVFASDAPFDPEQGTMFIRETIRVVDSLDVSDDVRARIYHGNAERLLNRRQAS
jgi:aminocarboxymuconate-semialdehyde decarboxylase